MKIWKLLGFAVLVTAAATAMLTSTGVAAGQSRESVTLVWWHNATQGEGLKLWTSVASEFHKLHPDVTVKAVPLQNEQFTTKIPIVLQSDSPPDVFQNWGGGQLVDQVKAGKVADLTKYVEPWIKTDRRLGRRLAGQRQAVRHPVQRRRRGVLVQQEALRAGRYHDAAEDLAELMPRSPSSRRRASRRSRSARRTSGRTRSTGTTLRSSSAASR